MEASCFCKRHQLREHIRSSSVSHNFSNFAGADVVVFSFSKSSLNFAKTSSLGRGTGGGWAVGRRDPVRLKEAAESLRNFSATGYTSMLCCSFSSNGVGLESSGFFKVTMGIDGGSNRGGWRQQEL